MKNITARIQPLLDSLQRYSITIAIILVSAVYGYLIYTSSTLVQVEPSDSEVTEKYQGAKRPKINEAIVRKLNELRDNNVNFQALVDEARDNPFAE